MRRGGEEVGGGSRGGQRGSSSSAVEVFEGGISAASAASEAPRRGVRPRAPVLSLRSRRLCRGGGAASGVLALARQRRGGGRGACWAA